MIIYQSDTLLGSLHDLSRIHGSAAYKAILPATFSTGMLLCYYFIATMAGLDDLLVIYHPYSIGAFVAFFSFLLTFRLNFSYGRYWEGASAVHLMQSKWLDCAMCMGAFHYQSAQFQSVRPPAFGANAAERIVGRPRAPIRSGDSSLGQTHRLHLDLGARSPSFWKKPNVDLASERKKQEEHGKSINSRDPSEGNEEISASETVQVPSRFQDQLLRTPEESYSGSDNTPDGGRWRPRIPKSFAVLPSNYRTKMPKPSLFLQETAHLVSLLSAVALATLRNDIGQAASPVVPYFPGHKWPAVDPDDLPIDQKRAYGESSALWQIAYFCMGLSRSKKRRTLYNAARPFGVLGGVSDEEIKLLQRARGPYAKVSLVSMWLQEFLSREYLAGSTGDITAPILSRCYQMISDGMTGYNQARKLAYIPFPFPSAQVTSFFSLAIIFVFPFLYGSFTMRLWFACTMNFLTVLCFLGLHEVARELENPFQNVPNDLPLTTFQAQFNEALVT